MKKFEKLTDSKFVAFEAMPKNSLFNVVGGKNYPTATETSVDQSTGAGGPIDSSSSLSAPHNDGYPSW